MPVLSGTKDIKGNTGFVYDISGDDIDSLVQEMIANADAPFTFVGRIGDVQQELTDPRHVGMTLANNGQAAATATVGGVRVNVQMSGNAMQVIPTDKDQSTADMFIGAGDVAMGYDDDDYDPFASAADDFPVPDPRARSQQLNDRYSDEEEYIEEVEYYEPASVAGGGDVVKVTDWLVTLILLAIPIVNIVVLILWLVSKKTNPSKKNYLKVYAIFLVIGLLLSAFGAFMLLQSGLVGTLISQTQPAYTQTYQNANNTTSNRRANVNENTNNNLNANENDNANANNNMNLNADDNNGGPASTIPEEQTSVGELSQSSSGMMAVESISRGFTPENRSIAIVTLTMMNPTELEASPASLIDITGMQGQNMLEANFMPVTGFAPDTFNMPIQPGQTGTFQISYFLVDDQDLKINASNKQTHDVLLDATQVLH